MEDGILLLLIRFYESEAASLLETRNYDMKYGYEHPDVYFDPALVQGEYEMDLLDLRLSLPDIVIDVAEGVDKIAFDEADDEEDLSEIPF